MVVVDGHASALDLGAIEDLGSLDAPLGFELGELTEVAHDAAAEARGQGHFDDAGVIDELRDHAAASEACGDARRDAQHPHEVDGRRRRARTCSATHVGHRARRVARRPRAPEGSEGCVATLRRKSALFLDTSGGSGGFGEF